MYVLKYIKSFCQNKFISWIQIEKTKIGKQVYKKVPSFSLHKTPTSLKITKHRFKPEFHFSQSFHSFRFYLILVIGMSTLRDSLFVILKKSNVRTGRSFQRSCEIKDARLKTKNFKEWKARKQQRYVYFHTPRVREFVWLVTRGVGSPLKWKTGHLVERTRNVLQHKLISCSSQSHDSKKKSGQLMKVHRFQWEQKHGCTALLRHPINDCVTFNYSGRKEQLHCYYNTILRSRQSKIY